MSQFLVLCSLMAVALVQLVQGQLIPLPTIPPITIPPITLPPITIPPIGVVVPTVTVCPAGYFANLLLCYPCPAGSTSASGDLTCSACAVGFYAPGPGSSSCTACGSGYTSSPARDTCVCGGGSKGKGKTGSITPNGTKGKGSTGSSTVAPIITVTIPPILGVTIPPITGVTIPPILGAPTVTAPVTGGPVKTKGKGKKGKE